MKRRQQPSPVEPQSSAALWGNMLGLGPIMQTASDPAFLATLKGVLDAIADTHLRCKRLEVRLERLDNLLSGLAVGQPAVPAQLGTLGNGIGAAASGIADNGDGGDPGVAGGTDRNHTDLVE